MPWLKSSGVSLTLRYTPKQVIPPIALRYISAPYHPIRPKILHMYENRDKNTLWWRVSITPLQSHKRVVRSWCARRARRAFEHALEKKGLDKLGHPLDPSQENQEIFKGSMEIITLLPIRNMPFDALLNEADTLLENIMKLRAHARERPLKPSVKNSTGPSIPSPNR